MSFGIKEDRYAEEEAKREEIVAKLRQVDVLVSQGQSTADAIRQTGESASATVRATTSGPTGGDRYHDPDRLARITDATAKASTAASRPIADSEKLPVRRLKFPVTSKKFPDPSRRSTAGKVN